MSNSVVGSAAVWAVSRRVNYTPLATVWRLVFLTDGDRLSGLYAICGSSDRSTKMRYLAILAAIPRTAELRSPEGVV